MVLAAIPSSPSHSHLPSAAGNIFRCRFHNVPGLVEPDLPKLGGRLYGELAQLRGRSKPSCFGFVSVSGGVHLETAIIHQERQAASRQHGDEIPATEKRR